jgi:hypothetical protein
MGIDTTLVAGRSVVIEDDFLVQLLEAQLNHPFAFSSASISASTSSLVL